MPTSEEVVSSKEYQNLLAEHRRLMEENKEILEDYQPLLKDNRVMGVGLMFRELEEFKRKVGEQFANLRRDPRVDDLEAQIDRLKERLQTQDERQHKRMTAMEDSQEKARKAYGDIRDDIEGLQKPKEPREPDDLDPASGGGEF